MRSVRHSSQRIRGSTQLATPKDYSGLFMVCVTIFMAVVVFRLFYIQVIKHDEYVEAARSDQFKRFEIPPERGTISLLSGNDVTPLILNRTSFLIVADPSIVKDKKRTSETISGLLGISYDDVFSKLNKPTRYELLMRDASKGQAEQVQEIGIPGILVREERVRSYPLGGFASSSIGFVNDDGEGQYGVEGALNSLLSGTPGQVRSKTDVEGIPLLQDDEGTVKSAVNGTDIVLSLDTTMQQIVDDEIKKGVERSGAVKGSAVIVEAHTGRVKAMSNYPSYDVSQWKTYASTPDVFQNRVVSDAFEPGSIMKTLTVASALDAGVIQKESTYYDPGVYSIDSYRITNAIDFGSGQFTVFDILRNSLNTGAIYLEKQLGGGELNESARTTWHNYLTESYYFGEFTGIEQEEEAKGYVPSPVEGDGLNIQYANMSFGQGISTTLLQMAAAQSAAVNGGVFYKPSLIQGTLNEEGSLIERLPEVVNPSIISPQASSDIVDLMMRYSDTNNRDVLRDGFVTGGKTGTAQIAKSNGGYRDDIFNATFVGFVGTVRPEYVIAIRLDQGKSEGGEFTGGKSARPVFTAITKSLMDSVSLAPRN
jgi:cell division protein FtsI (penicillin-binding protein 3)